MSLADVVLCLMLVALAVYTVLGGADFGAGFWQLWGGERARSLREHAHHSMGPVWETNHVWLIFVLVVCWTAYPTAFASIMSTLAVPLFIAAVGIILRGTAYALRSGTGSRREQRRIEVAFAVSSILTPFALGAVVGAIASGRVPVGNARGDLVTSWLNWTSVFVGVLTVAAAAYLAAVYLAADAARVGRSDLVAAFRLRALGAGAVAGALALVGLVVVRHDARPLWDGLTTDGLPAVLVSAAAGWATLALVYGNKFGPARVSAALAVAAIIAGWALAQRPHFLPGLTIEEAAASHSTLVAVLVAAGIAGVVLVPSLALLFSLFLHGRFDPHVIEDAVVPSGQAPGAVVRPELGALAAASFLVGCTLTFFFEAGWAHAVGITALVVFIATGFVALASLVATRDD